MAPGIKLPFDGDHDGIDTRIIEKAKQKKKKKCSRKKEVNRTKYSDNPYENPDSPPHKKRKKLHENSEQVQYNNRQRYDSSHDEIKELDTPCSHVNGITQKDDKKRVKDDSRLKRSMKFKKKKRTLQSKEKSENLENPKLRLTVTNEANKERNSAVENTDSIVTFLPEADRLEIPAEMEIDHSMYVALDCEFVGTGPKGCRSALGRCSIVDYNGNLLCDVYSKPEEWITDYRTRWSGLRRNYLRKAIPFENARYMIKKLIKGKIVIGHAIHNDLTVLGLRHPPSMIRDTCCYHPLHSLAAMDGECPPKSLKKLTKALFGRTIQKKTHCSREDALATLELFKLVQRQWEAEIANDSTPGQSRKRTFSETSLDNSYLNDRFWPANE